MKTDPKMLSFLSALSLQESYRKKAGALTARSENTSSAALRQRTLMNSSVLKEQSISW
jgi:hypothetical protein